ncbi:hypothetical protein Syn7803C17_50 [Synechococcus phage ACG-2014f]|uniref:Uncharacterized protein n=2 Tax=Atlauavirus tusconc8 TaxID=2734085 RepID=A0A0E3FSB1_9CAUD|nr:hypothetical protein HOQ62_gp051 [Synechococcus phage ACG-2014f_Syn7803C8]AIX31394.1 hypothetical protein Syn7803US40_50 [Synechococcus phage ACG-2014f]AIX21375.1 hypothetical protein Syn7803C8_51 [Synechococcus phage ACG-2014f_Syn7803C8]AIX31680.1 hypothetical protein Syn7803US42_52 [Synechococcus phage ACG-2014f]AIX33034.1 hypothetical protein Syn7803US50_50 [Synechococcus phage ACG-2014f]AIX41701.1 hypothetical protein Syn7803C14_50 [Synechococcus phage ACG-2014f]
MTEEDPMINWKQKMIEQCDVNGIEKQLLREGATSSVTAMGIMSLKKRYKRIMGIDDDPKPPVVQYASY